jgi:hypothetical protein
MQNFKPFKEFGENLSNIRACTICWYKKDSGKVRICMHVFFLSLASYLLPIILKSEEFGKEEVSTKFCIENSNF